MFERIKVLNNKRFFLRDWKIQQKILQSKQYVMMKAQKVILNVLKLVFLIQLFEDIFLYLRIETRKK